MFSSAMGEDNKRRVQLVSTSGRDKLSCLSHKAGGCHRYCSLEGTFAQQLPGPALVPDLVLLTILVPKIFQAGSWSGSRKVLLGARAFGKAIWLYWKSTLPPFFKGTAYIGGLWNGSLLFHSALVNPPYPQFFFLFIIFIYFIFLCRTRI